MLVKFEYVNITDDICGNRRYFMIEQQAIQTDKSQDCYWTGQLVFVIKGDSPNMTPCQYCWLQGNLPSVLVCNYYMIKTFYYYKNLLY